VSVVTIRIFAAWAGAVHGGQEPERAASRAWTSEHDYPREDKDREHVLVLGGEVDFASVLAEAGAPRPDETGDGWEPSEATRLGRYARRLWDGLLEREALVDR